VKKILYTIYTLFFSFVIGYSVFAAKTFDGAVKHSYEKGMEYPRKVARLKELGWQFEGGGERMVSGTPVDLTLAVVDREGRPVSGLDVVMEVSRPATPEALAPLAAREKEPGHYVADVTLPAYGHWQVVTRIHSQQEDFTHTFKIYAEKGEKENGA